MKSELLDFLDKNTSARWFALTASMIGTAVVGFISDSMGNPLLKSEILALCVGGGILVGLLFVHLISPRPETRPRRASSKSKRVFDRLRLPLILAAVRVPLFEILTFAALVISLSLSTAKLRSSVLDHRLQYALTLNDPQFTASETELVLKNAKQARLRLDPALVSAAVTNGASADRVVPEYAVDWSTISAAIDNNFASAKKPGPAMTMPSMVLGDTTLANTFVSNRTVVYGGQPLTLDNVHFSDTSFKIEDNVNGRRLADALLHTSDGRVSVVLR